MVPGTFVYDTARQHLLMLPTLGPSCMKREGVGIGLHQLQLQIRQCPSGQ